MYYPTFIEDYKFVFASIPTMARTLVRAACVGRSDGTKSRFEKLTTGQLLWPARGGP